MNFVGCFVYLLSSSMFVRLKELITWRCLPKNSDSLAAVVELQGVFIVHVLNLQDRAVYFTVLYGISQNLQHSIPDHCENTSDFKIPFCLGEVTWRQVPAFFLKSLLGIQTLLWRWWAVQVSQLWLCLLELVIGLSMSQNHQAGYNYMMALVDGTLF